MSPDSPLILLVVLLGVILAARVLRGRGFHLSGGMFNHPACGVVGAGCIASVATAWIWGGLRAPAAVQDEAAYLLQAGMFARGRWTLPSVSEFAAFTQAHVLVTPVIAAKYPPGHALALVPGVAIGLPGLGPVLLAGITAALLYAITRRIWTGSVAVLAVALWLTQAGQWRWRASYFSESTTAVLWLAGWWLLWRWREDRKPGWLIGLAMVTGWGAITRPLTMLVFALPVGAVVWHDVVRLRQWRSLALAVTVGAVILLALPIQNDAVLGSWRRSPLALYTRQYLPFDRVGFGLDMTPPELALPPDLAARMAEFVVLHRDYQPARVAGVLVDRLGHAWTTAFAGWRRPLIVAGVIGLLVLGWYGWFAVGSMIALYLAYLLYAHPGLWTLYYYEVTPVAAVVVALGLERILGWAIGGGDRLRWVPALAALGIIAVGFHDLDSSRHFRAADQQPFRRLQEAADSAGARTLVFVRYGPDLGQTVSLVRNVADPARAPMITAYDRGADANHRVAALFPNRTPVIWDDAAHRLVPGP